LAFLRSYELYESFRPDVPSGASGWGAKGQLSLDLVVEMAGDWAQNMAKFDGVVVAEVKEEVGGGGLQCVKREEEGGGNVVPDVKLEGMQGEKGAQGCLKSATEGVDGDVFGEEDDLGDAIVAEIAKAGPEGLKVRCLRNRALYEIILQPTITSTSVSMEEGEQCQAQRRMNATSKGEKCDVPRFISFSMLCSPFTRLSALIIHIRKIIGGHNFLIDCAVSDSKEYCVTPNQPVLTRLTDSKRS
jgi:hypothetical protein